ncbi:MAG TPA: hypothetical protein VM915_08160 [Verrucomicrobiae bacterium]|nr:hypothetical protein [Verrucomicrobiae bacterium]
MLWISIPHAHEYWRLNRREADSSSTLDEAEAFILNERPSTAQDAACILDVICANGGDVRCDGLDHAALGRVRSFLSASA